MTPSTPPTAKGVTEAMVEAAYDAFTRSFASSPIGTNNTRNDLRAALIAALSLPAPGEAEAGLTSPEAIKNLIGMVRAEAASWREPECYEPRDPVEEAGFLDVIANTLEALSTPAAPELGAVKALIDALKPFASIADMEPNAPEAASTFVNISRCRDARSALDAYVAFLSAPPHTEREGR